MISIQRARALRREEISALICVLFVVGVRLFVGGLALVNMAVAVRLRADGQLLTTDGPYMESKEHIGGFWILDVASAEDALEWGRKAASACRAPVEVRPFN